MLDEARSGRPLTIDDDQVAAVIERTLRTTPEIFEEIVESMALKRQVRPEEISYAVAWLASREADAVTGQNISPNCGQAIVGMIKTNNRAYRLLWY